MRDDRRARHRERPNRRIVLAWMLVGMLLLALNAAQIAQQRMPAAETAYQVALPLVALLLLMLMVGRIAWRLFGEESASYALVALVVAVPVLQHVQPTRIDPDIWPVGLAMLALVALMDRDRRRGAWVAGIAMAICAAMSSQGLGFSLALAGILALRWLARREEADWLPHYAAAFAAGAAGLVLLSRAWPAVTMACDRFSPLHIAIFGGTALGLHLVRRAGTIPMPLAGLLIGGLLVAGAAGHAGLAPRCPASGVAFGASPMWLQQPGIALYSLLPPLLGLWAAVKLFAQSRDWLRRWWFEYLLLLAAATVAALFDTRFAATACVLAAVPLGWQLCRWRRAIRTGRVRSQRYAALAGIALVAAPALAANAVGDDARGPRLASAAQIRPEGIPAPVR